MSIAKEPKGPNGAGWYDWKGFVSWAKRNGVDLKHKEDWEPWWECWKCGYCAAMNS